jgi:Outer membrane protein beta-barrel domain
MKAYTLLLAITIAFQTYSQTTKKRIAPNIPGSFVLEFGINRPQGTPTSFNAGLWGSRSLNVYYQYEVRLPILKSKFSMIPGIGFSFERFKVNSNQTLTYESGDLVMSRLNLDITKSQFITNYLDIPIELRYTKNPVDPRRSFYISCGLRLGMLVNGFTKIKYTDDNEGIIRRKQRQDWNLSNFRYGLYSKIGFGNIGLTGHYALSTLFTKNQGLEDTAINNLTIGISLSGF